MVKRKRPSTWWGKTWHFIWYDDSLASWLVNVVLAFLIIKFLLYPFLSLVLGTGLPLVAVVSQSMDHGYVRECGGDFVLCGEQRSSDTRVSFDEYWSSCGDWYEERGIDEEEFRGFPLRNGFSKGDIIVLVGREPSKVDVGDVIVFYSRAQEPRKPYPIIHRVVDKSLVDGSYVFQTKGDHNAEQISSPFDVLLDETAVGEDLVIGTAVARIPWLGWVKVGLVDLLRGGSC